MTDSGNFPLKNYYGVELSRLLAQKIIEVHPAFPAEDFVAYVAGRVEPLELKGRSMLQAEGLRQFLPQDYPQAVEILLHILGEPLAGEAGVFNDGFWIMPIAGFVEAYGLEHFDVSMDALYHITQRFSSEFVVRPYLLRYQAETLEYLRGLVNDENMHVRRWVSEGIRPRLPWGLRLHPFVADPSPVLEILEHLKDDPALYVRRSVANNLNDIAKDHPEKVIALLTRWSENASDGTNWIIRHALRTQIKKGDAQALALLGYGGADTLKVEAFNITPREISINEKVEMECILVNHGDAPVETVIDYVVHFVKANGKTSPKVFKWGTRTINSGEKLTLIKRHAFRDVSVRKHYAGIHRIDVQVNGQALASADVSLVWR